MPLGRGVIPALAALTAGWLWLLVLPSLPFVVDGRGHSDTAIARWSDGAWPALIVALLPAVLIGRAWSWRLLCLSGVGCMWAIWSASLALGERWPDARDREGVRFRADVIEAEVSRTAAGPLRLLVAPRPRAADPPLPRRILVWVWPNALAALGAQPRGGDCLQLQARLRAPHGAVNPGGFDLEARALRRGIGAHAGAVSLHRCAEVGAVPIAARLARLRADWRARIEARSRQLSGGAAETVRALLVGDRTEVPADWRAVSRETGTAHLFTVSGMHVAAVAAPVRLAALPLARLLALVQPGVASLVPILASTGAAAAFALAVGGGAATLRAVLMCLLLQVGGLTGRNVGAWSRWWWALLLALLFDPLMVLDTGAWLSWVAVTVLLLAFAGADSARRPGDGIRSRARRLVAAQCLLLIALAPFQAQFGSDFSLAALPANLVAVPLVTLLVLPAALLGVWLPEALGKIALSFAADVLALLFALLQTLARMPQLPLSAGAAPTLLIVPLVLSAGWIGLRRLLLPGVLLVGLLVPAGAPPPAGSLDWQVLDVGHGLAVLLRTRSGVVLYDVGGLDAGGAVVAALRAAGWPAPDLILISHLDADHVSGLARVLRVARGRRLRLVTPEPEALARRADVRAALAASGADVTFEDCRPQQSLRDDVVLRWFSADRPADRNAGSCVLLVAAPRLRLLLPGDIDATAEARLLGALTPVDLLVSAHHGSKGSNSDWFVARTRPERVIHSVPFGSRYGHPHAVVVARYQRIGARQRCTFASGALAGRDGMPPRELRIDQPRWWRRRVVCPAAR